MPREQEPTDARSFDTEGLVLPRKLPNPNVESREKKDLHKEMLWKMKFGGNDPKDCELQKAYANFANRQRVKEIELEKANQMTFEKLLEEQKQRLHSVGVKAAANNNHNQTTGANTAAEDSGDELRPHLATTIDDLSVESHPNLDTPTSHDEFYRVFSKVRAKTYHGSELAAVDSTKAIDQRTKAI